MLKTDKRKKYLEYYDVYNCLDCKLNLDFKIYSLVTNKINGRKTYDVMILEFTRGYKQVDNIELNKIKDIIKSSYPKAIVEIVTEQHTCAPELNENFISVSTKL